MTPRSARRPLRVLISAGPTREPIDPVRFLSNYSTGYLGSCLASEALRRGHRVTLVSGPTTMPPPPGTQVVWVERAQEMQAVLRRVLDHCGSGSDFGHQQFVVLLNVGVRTAERHSTDEAVCTNQSIKGIAGPAERQCLLGERD